MPGIHYHNLAEVEAWYWWHVSRLNWAEKFLKEGCFHPETLNILDYGCGTGGFLYALNKRLRFKSCLGVDCSDKAIQLAKVYGDCFRQIKPGDFRVPEVINLILLMDVLEHFKNDEDFLRTLVSGIKNNVYVLVSVPALPYLYSGWDKSLGHYRRYTKQSLSELINKIGGKIIKIEYCFSYLIPAVLIKRVWLKTLYTEENCTFPAVPKFLNIFLLMINHLEMFLAKYLRLPLGTSIFCLFEKRF